MALSLEQLEAFMAAVETGSFSAAARKLGKAQSSVSGLISNLESDTGLPLFDRSTREPRLTRQGQALMEDIKSVLKSHNHLRYRISNLANKVELEIGLAYDNQLINDQQIKQLLNDFEQQFPGTSLRLLHAAQHGAYRLLDEHKVDLAIGLRHPDSAARFGVASVGQVQFAKVASADHPLVELKELRDQDLQQHRQLKFVDTQAHGESNRPGGSNAWYCNAPETLLSMLRMGLGWADLPLPWVEKELQSGQVVHLHSHHQATSFPHSLDIMWRREGEAGKCQQWLRNRLELQLTQSYQPPPC